MCGVLYTRSHGRRPIWTGGWQPDPQGAIPARWCEQCGAEVFAREDGLCRRCGETRKELMEDEDQSLYDLQPGEGPGELRK